MEGSATSSSTASGSGGSPIKEKLSLRASVRGSALLAGSSPASLSLDRTNRSVAFLDQSGRSTEGAALSRIGW